MYDINDVHVYNYISVISDNYNQNPFLLAILTYQIKIGKWALKLFLVGLIYN